MDRVDERSGVSSIRRVAWPVRLFPLRGGDRPDLQPVVLPERRPAPRDTRGLLRVRGRLRCPSLGGIIFGPFGDSPPAGSGGRDPRRRASARAPADLLRNPPGAPRATPSPEGWWALLCRLGARLDGSENVAPSEAHESGRDKGRGDQGQPQKRCSRHIATRDLRDVGEGREVEHPLAQLQRSAKLL